MRLAADEEVDRDQGDEAHNGQDPQGQGNIHCASGSRQRNVSATSLPEVSSTPGIRRAQRARNPRADAPGSGQIRIDGYAAQTGSTPLRAKNSTPITKER
ncbi:hypothetical protein GCM10027074_00730 [Streptomyces deserti]